MSICKIYKDRHLRLNAFIFSMGLIGATFFALTPTVSSQEENTQKYKQVLNKNLLKEKPILNGIVENPSTNDGFFFFQNSNESQEVFELGNTQGQRPGWSIRGGTSFTPRSGPLLKGFGEVSVSIDQLALGGFTPRNANAELVLSYSSGDRNGDGKSKSLDLALISHVSSQGGDKTTGVLGSNIGKGNNLSSYDVGFSVGYSGFNLGASVKQEAGAYLDSIKGYDLGFSYSGGAWSTELVVGDYSQKNSYLSGTYGYSQVNFYALEFGASYRLGSIFRLRGGVRYLDFYDRYGMDPYGLSVANKQELYLGTNINF